MVSVMGICTALLVEQAEATQPLFADSAFHLAKFAQ